MQALLTGIATTLLLLLNTLILIGPMLAIALLKLILPGQHLRDACSRGVMWIAETWAENCKRVFAALTPTHWDIRGGEGLRSDTSYLLINHLAERFNVAQVVFEARNTRKMLRYRLRTLGAWTVLGQLVFLAWDRLYLRPRSRLRIEQLLAGHDIRPPDGRIPTIDVRSVNGEEVTTLLQRHQPRVVVVELPLEAFSSRRLQHRAARA